MTPKQFWEKLATRSQSNLYFALLFTTRERREAFRDVYRFLRAADDVADSGLPLAEIQTALAAWRRELDAVYAGHAAEPIAQRLARTVARYRLPREHFDRILDALAEDATGRTFADQASLEAWAEAMSSTLGYLCLAILDVHGPGPTAYARDLGVALQLANIVRDVAEDARRGRLYLPLDELRAAGASAQDVLALRWTPGFRRAAAAEAARVRGLVARARARLDASDRRKLLVPEIWADVYLALLRELERKRFDVFTAHPYLSRRKKLAIACVRWLAFPLLP
ncbi:MAG TPA: squalene/phytoene synthase family protein [Haliangiales bacterium]|nr:squalene/phytoene synthase family protein [Haliangiales bacterium]